VARLTDYAPKKGEEWQSRFLDVLANSANVRLSCAAANVTRDKAYRHRNTNPAFAKAWDTALEEAADLLDAEAWRRSIKGLEKGVYYRGIKVDVVKEFSDTLLIFLMKAHRPEKYRDNFDAAKLLDILASVRNGSAMAEPGPGRKKAVRGRPKRSGGRD
jgi:hypothetical protein